MVSIVGSGLKWLYGTLDDEDKKDIEYHFPVVDENNHDLINNKNQQIKININFNTAILHFKKKKIEAETKF